LTRISSSRLKRDVMSGADGQVTLARFNSLELRRNPERPAASVDPEAELPRVAVELDDAAGFGEAFGVADGQDWQRRDPGQRVSRSPRLSSAMNSK
jgi:hypothetical protein